MKCHTAWFVVLALGCMGCVRQTLPFVPTPAQTVTITVQLREYETNVLLQRYDLVVDANVEQCITPTLLLYKAIVPTVCAVVRSNEVWSFWMEAI